jgi:hypothetical protein
MKNNLENVEISSIFLFGSSLKKSSDAKEVEDE